MNEKPLLILKLFFLLVCIRIPQTSAQPFSLTLIDSVVVGTEDYLKPASVSTDGHSILLCYKNLRKVIQVQVNDGKFGMVNQIYQNPSSKRYRNAIDVLSTSLSPNRLRALGKRLEPELYVAGEDFHILMNGLRAFVFDNQWKLLSAKGFKTDKRVCSNGNRNYEQSTKVVPDRDNPESFWLGVEMHNLKTGTEQIGVVKFGLDQAGNRKNHPVVRIIQCRILPLRDSLSNLYRLGFFWDFDINPSGEAIISIAGNADVHVVNGTQSRILKSGHLTQENTWPDPHLPFAQQQFQFTLKTSQNTGIANFGKSEFMIRTRLAPLKAELLNGINWSSLSRIQWSEYASLREGVCELLDRDGNQLASFTILPHDNLVGVKDSVFFIYRLNATRSQSIIYSYHLRGFD